MMSFRDAHVDSALVWFRRDLRLDDHAVLHQALHSARKVHGVFVFDTEILDGLEARADPRVAFMWASVAALQARLREVGGDLAVLHGPARQLIPEWAKRLGVSTVFAGRDYEPAAKARDAAVAAALARDGRALRLVKDQVIFDGSEVLNGKGEPFRVFTPYKRTWLARLDAAAMTAFPIAMQPDRLAADEVPGGMPNLAALGFEAVDLAGLGVLAGESGARACLAGFLERIDAYHALRDFPADDATSRLSVHLRFGTLSIRELVRIAVGWPGRGAEAWLSELIWREFYQMLLDHFPGTAEHAFKPELDRLPWPNPPGHFEAWCAARTGYPIVDAAMRQLNRSGFMHNRLRMVAASFLVKDLHVDWRWGERYFAAKLIDYDLAANVGGWQWSASVGTDAQPWFRIFNPVAQSERFDPEGRFLRHWLPELAQVPLKHLHAPWRMSAAMQAACGVVIGRDYPPPIVDHAGARAVTLALFRQALHAPSGTGSGSGVPA